MSNNVTVPQCAAHVSASLYSAEAQATFNPISWNYYKTYVTSAQVLPGFIFGVLCWIVAIVFTIWLLTLCCRSVSWRSRRSRVHDIPVQGSVSFSRRNKWVVFNIVLFLAILGVIATGVWALISGIKSTDGSVNEFWGILDVIIAKLQGVSVTLQGSSTNIANMQASGLAAYTLINNNQAAAASAGVNVPPTLAQLQATASILNSGSTATQDALSAVEGTGIVKVEELQNDWQKKSEDAWKLYRVIAIAVFFGILIFFGVIGGVLALLDRTPRLTATATLLLFIWTGFVLILGAGEPETCFLQLSATTQRCERSAPKATALRTMPYAGALSLVWRVSRDACLYGIDYAAVKIGGEGNIQARSFFQSLSIRRKKIDVMNYYFGRTTIAPQDVSQQLFNVNLTQINSDLNNPDIASMVAALQTSSGQSLVSTASPSDQAAINALPSRISALQSSVTTLNTEIQASSFRDVVGSVTSLICCSTTTALWTLWLASILTGATAALLASMTLAKVVMAISPAGDNMHYTPQSPNAGIFRRNKGFA